MKHQKKFVRIMAVVLAAVMTITMIAGILATTAGAVSSTEIQERIDELEDESDSLAQRREELEQQIALNSEQEAGLLEQKAVLDRRMTLTWQEIENIREKIDQYEYLISEKEAELDEAENAEKLLYEQYKERLRALEENGKVTYLAILFQANSFSNLLDRLDIVQDIHLYDQQIMRELSAASEKIRTAQDTLAESRQKLQAEFLALEEKEADLEAQAEEVQKLIDRYSSEGVILQELYEEYEARRLELLLEIFENQEAYKDAVEEEEAARKAAEEEERRRQEEEQKRQEEEQKREENNRDESAENDSPVQPPATDPEPEEEPPVQKPDPTPDPEPDEEQKTEDELPSEIPGGAGVVEPEPEKPRFIVPLTSYVLTDTYGWRIHPIYGYEKFHYGIDMSAPAGTPIYATASGTVIVATEDPEGVCGNYVMITHSGGYMSSYLHMTSYCVSVGQYVNQGDVIGYVGSTGLSTGPHLHFAMYHNGSFVNPMDYIG